MSEPKPKTYADDFFEKFPNAPKDENGLPKPYLCDVYASKGFECFGCTIEDGRKCWLEQYPEQGKKMPLPDLYREAGEVE